MIRYALLAAVLALPAAVHAQDSVKPGYWEAVDEVPLLHKRTVDKICVTPAKVAKFMSGPSNHIYACAYPEHTAADGVIRFRGRCVDKKGFGYGISGEGRFTETTLSLTGHATVLGLPIKATTDAHRVGDICPPDAK